MFRDQIPPLQRGWAEGSDVSVEEVRDRLAASPRHCSVASPGSCVQCPRSVFAPFSPHNRKTFAVKTLNKIFLLGDSERLLWTALDAALAASAWGSGCLIPPS